MADECKHPEAAFTCSVCSQIVKVCEKQSKLYAIDYDKTITTDIDMWVEFIKLLELRGHKVVIVTMRSHEEKQRIDERVSDACAWIVPTNRKAKKQFCKDFGIEPDIWIDDEPQYLFVDATDPKLGGRP